MCGRRGAKTEWSGERAEAVDAGVGATEVVREDAGDVVDVEGARGGHLLEVGPVLRAVEERLEHREVGASEKRHLTPAERLPAAVLGEVVVELGGVHEDVDG